jgi:hypothetical protein
MRFSIGGGIGPFRVSQSIGLPRTNGYFAQFKTCTVNHRSADTRKRCGKRHRWSLEDALAAEQAASQRAARAKERAQRMASPQDGWDVVANIGHYIATALLMAATICAVNWYFDPGGWGMYLWCLLGLFLNPIGTQIKHLIRLLDEAEDLLTRERETHG